MSLPVRPVARLRRRLFLGEFLHEAAGWLAGFLILFGLAVLAVKLFAPQLWPYALWGALGIIPTLGVAYWRSLRRMPTDRETLAVLDSRLNAGGLLMTLAERPDAAWEERLPGPESLWASVLPRVRPVRFAKAVAVPALFAVGAGFIPARVPPPPAPKVTVGTDAAKKLAETFALLEEADALDEEKKEELRAELDKLAAESQEAPLTHEKWETVDALRERLTAGLDATDMAVSQGMAAAGALAAAMAGGQPLSAERSAQLQADIEEALETLRKNGALPKAGAAGSSGLSSDLQRLMKNGQFGLPSDAAARKQALDDLQKYLDAEAKKLSECRGKCQGSLCKGGNCQGTQPGGNRPGRGGITRGRGDAEMSYGDESDDQAIKFKETVLPPGLLDQPTDNVVGMTASAPQVDPTGPEARTTARDAGPTTGQTTWDRPLRPRHREVVRGYFGDGAK